MRLSDLNPQFIGAGGPGIYNVDMTQAEARHGVGLMCNCPCGCGSNLFVPFNNPLDGKPSLHQIGNARWDRVGDDFATLTLTPSIKRIPHNGSCGWHGFIRNGEIETCGDSTPASDEFIKEQSCND